MAAGVPGPGPLEPLSEHQQLVIHRVLISSWGIRGVTAGDWAAVRLSERPCGQCMGTGTEEMCEAFLDAFKSLKGLGIYGASRSPVGWAWPPQSFSLWRRESNRSRETGVRVVGSWMRVECKAEGEQLTGRSVFAVPQVDPQARTGNEGR